MADLNRTSCCVVCAKTLTWAGAVNYICNRCFIKWTDQFITHEPIDIIYNVITNVVKRLPHESAIRFAYRVWDKHNWGIQDE